MNLLQQPVSKLKKCCTCKIEQPKNKFSKDKNKKDGLSANCKTCASEYRKTYQKGEKYKNYCKTPERKFVVYRTTAKKKNIKFDLTLEEFSEALSEKKCFYCGDKSEFALGIDRINRSEERRVG